MTLALIFAAWFGLSLLATLVIVAACAVAGRVDSRCGREDAPQTGTLITII